MTRSHVLIDGYFLGKPYGFGRFASELLTALSRAGAAADIDISVAVPADADFDTSTFGPGITVHVCRPANFVVWEQFTVPRLARRVRADVIHFPYNTRALWTRGIPVVLTVHDLLFLEPREAAPTSRKDRISAAYAKNVFKMAARRAKAVVSVSDTTRRALAELSIPAETVYNTVDDFVSCVSSSPVAGGGAPYVLHRGGTAAHRNTGRMLDAFAVVREEYPAVELRIVGVPQGQDIWPDKPHAGVTFLARQTDAELADLYAGSACVAATSLREGFGLPIIEAFALHAPVVTSDVDPMREVAGGAAILVDPTDSAAIAAAVRSVLADPDLASSLVTRGIERYKSFTGDKVASGMLRVYARVIAAH